MKTNVADTSILAFHSLQKTNNKQLSVLQVIAVMKTACDFQIAKYLNWPINRVNPRRNELVKSGHIVLADKHVNPETDKISCFWKLNT